MAWGVVDKVKHSKHDVGPCPWLSPPPTQCALTFQPPVHPNQHTHTPAAGGKIKANKNVGFSVSRCPGLKQHPQSLHLGLNPASSSHLPVCRSLQLHLSPFPLANIKILSLAFLAATPAPARTA